MIINILLICIYVVYFFIINLPERQSISFEGISGKSVSHNLLRISKIEKRKGKEIKNRKKSNYLSSF